MKIRILSLYIIANCLIISNLFGQFPYNVKDPQTFFSNINLNYSGLESVKKAVNNNNYNKAIESYIDFLSNRNDRTYMYRAKDCDSMVYELREFYPYYEKELLKKTSNTVKYRLNIEGEIYEWPNGDIHWRTEHKQWISVLNRMQYMPELGLAYWYTHDITYFNCFWHWFEDWYVDNPVPDYQVNLTGGSWLPAVQSYTSPGGAWLALNTGIRVGSLISAYFYFENVPAFSKEKKWIFICSLMEHERYIYEYLKRCALGNWEMMVASGFLQLAVMTPEWNISNDILKYSKKTLENNYIKSINDEGFQFERTLGYHRHIVPSGVKALYLLKELNGIDCFSPEVEKKIYKSFDLVVNLIKPNNDDPSMGDMEIRKPYYGPDTIRYDSFFSSAALLFKDCRFNSLAGNLSIEDYLFFGKQGLKRFLSIPKICSDTVLRSRYFPLSKLAIMRSGKAFIDSCYNSIYCLFDNGPDGVGSHSHHDFLNIELFAYDKTLIIDPGRGNNYDHPLFRNYYRTVKAHNVVQIGENEKMQLKKGPNSNLVQNQVWSSTPFFDYARGILYDYEKCNHIRNLFFVKGEYFFLRDYISGDSQDLFKQYFHLPPGKVVINHTKNMAITNYANHANIAILSTDSTNLIIKVDSGYIATGSDNVFAPIVTNQKRQKLPVSFSTILYPIKKEQKFPEFSLFPIHTITGNDTSSAFILSYYKDKTIKKDYFYYKNTSYEDNTKLKGNIAFCRESEGIFSLLALYGEYLMWNNFSIKAPEYTSSYIKKDNTNYECYTELSNTCFQVIYQGITPKQLLLNGQEIPFTIDEKNKLLNFQVPEAGLYIIPIKNPQHLIKKKYNYEN